MSSPRTAAAAGPHAGLEVLKLIACFGIVVFHLGLPGSTVGYAGLPVFMLVTTALLVPAAAERPWRPFVAAKLRRLLWPWLAWSLLYALLQGQLALMQGRSFWSWPEPSMLLVGTYPHLWYLPFAALVTLGVGGCVHQAGRLATSPRQVAAWSLVAAALIPVCSHWLQQGPGAPFSQWLFVTPAIAFGIACSGVPRGERAADGSLGIAVAAAWLGASTDHWLGGRDLPVPYAVAVPAVALAWRLPWVAGPGLLRWTQASFGVYLLHHAVLLGLAWTALQLAAAPPAGLVLAIVFGGSLLLTVALRATRLRPLL